MIQHARRRLGYRDAKAQFAPRARIRLWCLLTDNPTQLLQLAWCCWRGGAKKRRQKHAGRLV
jgi:hypothetical protein